MRRVSVVLLAVILPALASATTRSEALGLRFSVPDGWKRVQSALPLVAAEFRIPRERRDPEDGRLVLFQFGAAKGGGVSDNLERWYAEFTPPDGRASREAAIVSTRQVNGLDVTLIDLAGSYRPQLGPMEHRSSPDYRMLGAVVEGQGGPWFWRAVGPAATIDKAKAGFNSLVESFEIRR